MKLMLKLAALVFVGACFVIVGWRLFESDWSNRPTINQIQAAHEVILFSLDVKATPQMVSKVTFEGYSTQYHTDASMEAEISRFCLMAAELGWHQKTTARRSGYFRAVYCAENIAHDIEIRQRTNEADISVDVGSYWAAERGDFRFCR